MKKTLSILALLGIVSTPALAAETPDFTIFFAKDMYLPRGTQIVPTAKLIEFLQANPEKKVVLVGHADTTGSEAANTRISRKRAWQLGATLEECGIDTNRIEVKWVGEKELLTPTANDVAEAKNRVVEVFVK
jgi:outer membrane protein OmpA-like peptidoglycan-associated protein